MLFGQSMINLSGAVNVLLFLVIRPELLLFPPPEMHTELETEMPHLKASPAILPDTVQYERSAEMAGVGVVEELDQRSRNITFENSGAPFPVGSAQRDV